MVHEVRLISCIQLHVRQCNTQGPVLQALTTYINLSFSAFQKKYTLYSSSFHKSVTIKYNLTD